MTNRGGQAKNFLPLVKGNAPHGSDQFGLVSLRRSGPGAYRLCWPPDALTCFIVRFVHGPRKDLRKLDLLKARRLERPRLKYSALRQASELECHLVRT